MAAKRKQQQCIPSFVPGRKGRISVVDCIVGVLWKALGSNEADVQWPARTFDELRSRVSQMQGYQVTSSTIRSAVYSQMHLFERTLASDGTLKWRLSKEARK